MMYIITQFVSIHGDLFLPIGSNIYKITDAEAVMMNMYIMSVWRRTLRCFCFRTV